jgi:hypothetical protein
MDIVVVFLLHQGFRVAKLLPRMVLVGAKIKKNAVYKPNFNANPTHRSLLARPPNRKGSLPGEIQNQVI